MANPDVTAFVEFVAYSVGQIVLFEQLNLTLILHLLDLIEKQKQGN